RWICDPSGMLRIYRLSKLFVALLAISVPCLACVRAYVTEKVGETFQVRMEHAGRPVEGFRLAARGPSGKSVTVAETDDNGIAQFRRLPEGRYSLIPEQPDSTFSAPRVEVKADGPQGVTIREEWPTGGFIAVRALKGAIYGPQYLPGQSQPKLSLELLDGIS